MRVKVIAEQSPAVVPDPSLQAVTANRREKIKAGSESRISHGFSFPLEPGCDASLAHSISTKYLSPAGQWPLPDYVTLSLCLNRSVNDGLYQIM